MCEKNDGSAVAEKEKGPLSSRDNGPSEIGLTGFEPATSWSRRKRSLLPNSAIPWRNRHLRLSTLYKTCTKSQGSQRFWCKSWCNAPRSCETGNPSRGRCRRSCEAVRRFIVRSWQMNPPPQARQQTARTTRYQRRRSSTCSAECRQNMKLSLRRLPSFRPTVARPSVRSQRASIWRRRIERWHEPVPGCISAWHGCCKRPAVRTPIDSRDYPAKGSVRMRARLTIRAVEWRFGRLGAAFFS